MEKRVSLRARPNQGMAIRPLDVALHARAEGYWPGESTGGITGFNLEWGGNTTPFKASGGM
jgi:hypothetical protein